MDELLWKPFRNRRLTLCKHVKLSFSKGKIGLFYELAYRILQIVLERLIGNDEVSQLSSSIAPADYTPTAPTQKIFKNQTIMLHMILKHRLIEQKSGFSMILNNVTYQ